MSDNLSNYFDEESRTILKEGVSAWHALKRHPDRTYWLQIGKAIATAQDIAAEVSGQGGGRKFNKFMARCYSMPSYLGEFSDMDKSDRSRAARLWRERDAVEKLLAALGQTRALRLNNPKAILDALDASRRPVSDKPTSASPFAQLKQANQQLQEEVDRLKTAQNGEITISHKDSDTNIALTLTTGFGDRWPRIQASITRLRKRTGA